MKSLLLQDLKKRGGLVDNADKVPAIVVYVDTGRNRGRQGHNGAQRNVSCPPYWNRPVIKTDPRQDAAICRIASGVRSESF